MTPKERKYFFDCLYGGEEIIFTLFGKKYCVQGYFKNNSAHMYLTEWKPEEKIRWKTDKDNMTECAELFLDTPMWNGKSFWEVEEDFTWVDC